tara:strand:- start:49840 stop:50208 length:369 start_codon:yes stop_codon:yes gene_type:complete
MEVQELRLGNLVNYKQTTHRIKSVGRIISTIVRLNGDVYDSGASQIDPIPLTEEWINNFGFDSSWKKGDFQICTTSEHEYGTLYYKSKDNGAAFLPVVLKYVHQLQNLYFALTGEELVLNDK